MRRANEELKEEEIMVEGTATDEGINEGTNLIPKEEAEKLRPILQRFIDAYKTRNPEETDSVWLSECYKRELPDWDTEKINCLTEDTLASIKEYDSNLADIEAAARQGISSEKWFASAVEKASVGMAVNEYGQRLAAIDTALTNGNAQMMRTVTTQAGEISGCYNLDGFIAEQYHVNTFNAEAALKNSKFVAEVKVPGPGEVYGKNSFDLVIKDSSTGKIVQQYQAKYGATAQDTIKLLKSGNYNNQRFLVPSEQVAEVQAAFPGKSVTGPIGDAETGVFSKPRTTQEAKLFQKQVQEQGTSIKIDYNTFQTKELALHIGQNAGLVGLQSAALAAGMSAVASLASGDGIDGDALIETALVTGADGGIKAAAAGALKVGAEKGVIALLPPGTPVHVIANIACVGIEDIKILMKVASGELTMQEALDKMGRTTTAMIYGLSWGLSGAVIGAAALAWIPIVGPFVGGLIGGMVGYMAGSKFGEAIYDGAKKILLTAKKAASKAWEGVKNVGRKIASGARNVLRSVGRMFGF